jgi:pyruvate/2-oxoglutarate dehydrogenase complex dihydrolipoamide dehydrogenase (E3) component
VLTREDPEIGLGLTKYLRDEGIDLRTQAAVERVDRADPYRIRVSRSGQTEVLEADQLAARRRATGFLLATDEI